MDTADDPRPTYQWPTWRDALLALASAKKGPRPRLARSTLHREPGDRPPELEDFVRLREVLTACGIDDGSLRALTGAARGRALTPADNAARLRLERGLRRHRLTPPPLQLRTETFEALPAKRGDKAQPIRMSYVA